ncbi:glycosyltransferase family 9 protein [Candidatus Zixiibacteriota bacterium]
MEKLKPIEHKFKAFFFGVFRIFLSKGQTDFKLIGGESIKKVLFLRPEKLGDMVISFPVFDGLRRNFPHIKISILGSPKNIAIIRNDPRFEKIYLYTKNLFHDIKELFAMRKAKYDCVVDMIGDDSVTALFLSQMCAPGKLRIGIGKTKYKHYYDYNYAYRTDNTNHIIENTLKLLDAFGIDSTQENGYAEPYIKPDEDKTALDFISGIENGSQPALKVGYNLSAGSLTRIWDEQNSIELINQIVNEYSGTKIILFTAPSERSKAINLKNKLNNEVFIIPEKLNLTTVSAIIRYLNILITPDTSLVHIARSFKVPVIGLYSRFMKNFMLWRPYDQEVGAVVSGNDDNIYDITVNQVFDNFKKLMENVK